MVGLAPPGSGSVVLGGPAGGLDRWCVYIRDINGHPAARQGDGVSGSCLRPTVVRPLRSPRRALKKRAAPPVCLFFRHYAADEETTTSVVARGRDGDLLRMRSGLRGTDGIPMRRL
jgi:hypothetical protein